MSRSLLVCTLALVVGRTADAGVTLATPPLVGDESQHVVCLVSNVGARPVPLRVVVAGPFSMEELSSSRGAPLPPGSFNAYSSTQFAGYCKVEIPQQGAARGLRVAACLAGSGRACVATVEGR